MFDIGFSELLVIAVVALIVIGPERLPKVARTLGHLFGRMQRYVNDVKADITREMELEELRKLQSSVEDAARSIQDSVNRQVSETRTELDKVAEAIQPPADSTAPAGTDPGAHPVVPPAAEPVSPQLDLALESKAEPTVPAPKPQS
ncbi:MAG TPA: Sec-independent protein translocase protein TatB [Burkholderiales bacterium]|nr:Sec-independent protein translocase protein TatB [Burkholderiales bacterium]